MQRKLFVLFAIMQLGCGNKVPPEEPMDEASVLREIVLEVREDLMELGFAIDTSEIKIEVKEESDMAALFNEISDESRLEVANYTPFGPEVFEQQIQEPKFRDGANSRLAFYDPNSNSIVFKKDSLHVLTKGYLAHELAHAYQDQKWGFNSIWKSYHNDPSREAFNIAQFIIEGHAELVRHAYEQNFSGPRGAKKISETLGKMSENDCIPCHSQQSLTTLPYVFGMRFLVNQYRSGGWARVESLFTDLPLSTEQIIHEDKYQKDKPTHFSMPVWHDSKYHQEPVLNGSLGEAFLLAKLLNMPIPPEQALAAASGWDGDVAQLYRFDDGREAMVWRVVFDRVYDAQQLEDAVKGFGPESEAFRLGRVVDWIVTKYPDLRVSLRKFMNNHPVRFDGDLIDEQSTTEQEASIQNDANLFNKPYFTPKISIGAR